MANDIANEGTIATVLQHHHPDWLTNRAGYRFPEIESHGIRLSATKNYDQTLTVSIDGPFGNSYDFKVPIPESDENQLHVAVTWSGNEVRLFLNRKRVKTRRTPRKAH